MRIVTRTRVAIVLLVILFAVAQLVDRLIERELSGILEPLLQMPVAVSGLQLHPLSLSASIERLRLGSSDSPALLAEQLRAGLSWPELSSGELRLLTASADSLEVAIDRWTPSEKTTSKPTGSTPFDYRSIEPWLPASLKIRALSIRADDQPMYRMQAVRLNREADHAAVKAKLSSDDSKPELRLQLASVDQLLALDGLIAELEISDFEDVPASKIDLKLMPRSDVEGYSATLSGTLVGTSFDVSASADHNWSLPSQSDTQLKEFHVADFLTLAAALAPAVPEADLSAEPEPTLTRALPPLALPEHTANFFASSLTLSSQAFHDFALSLETGPAGARVSALTVHGPYSVLTGQASLSEQAGEWTTTIGATIDAETTSGGILARYNDTRFLAESGKIDISARGRTAAGLLEQLSGDIQLQGRYRGDHDTPLALSTTLGSDNSGVSLGELQLTAGDSTLRGRMHWQRSDISNNAGPTLTAEFQADGFDLRFLQPAQAEAISAPQLPTWLGMQPQLTLDLKADIRQLQLNGLLLAGLSVDLRRGAEAGGGTLAILGPGNGSASIALDYTLGDADKYESTLQIEANDLDLLNTFQMDGGTPVRASGKMSANAAGDSWQATFESLAADTSLQLETWPSDEAAASGAAAETYSLEAALRLLVDDTSIQGLKLDVSSLSSPRLDLQGAATVALNRQPQIQISLTGDRLDLDSALAALGGSKEVDATPTQAGSDDFLVSLLELPTADFRLDLQQVTWRTYTAEDLTLALTSAPGRFKLTRLDFQLAGAKIVSTGGLDRQVDAAQGSTVLMNAEMGLANLYLRKLLPETTMLPKNSLRLPMSGSVSLTGEGTTFTDIFSGLTGHIRLDDNLANQGDERVAVSFERNANAGQVRINEFDLAGSRLQGDITIRKEELNTYKANLQGERIDLRPWESLVQHLNETADNTVGETSALVQSASFVKGALGFVGSMVGVRDDGTAATRLFSSEPISVEPLSTHRIEVDANVDHLISDGLIAEDVSLHSALADGRFDVEAKAVNLNGGGVKVKAAFDSTSTPYAAQLSAMLDGVHKDPEEKLSPLTVDANFTSEGVSQAALAANLNGTGYVALGRGQLNIEGMALLSADVATSALRTLIPGAKTKPPELRCAVTVLQAAEGHLGTPFGYAARTGTANLLGGMDIDLSKELITLKFKSQSRDGVGISIGNAFSGSVEVGGPLSNPQILPNTPGLLLRGWAAFATAGLSVVGESVLNRALASNDPCAAIQEEIRKRFCPAGQPLAGSRLACSENP